MDFMATECGILLTFLCLLHGISVDGIAPCVLTNKVVLIGDRDVQLANISCENDKNKLMALQVLPIEEKEDTVIVSNKVEIITGFYLQEPQQQTDESQQANDESATASMCHYNIKTVQESSAGVYRCWKYKSATSTRKVGVVSALLIVFGGNVTCSFVSRPCDIEWKYTCGMGYYANDSYVDARVEWRINGQPQSGPGDITTDPTAFPLIASSYTYSITRYDVQKKTDIPRVSCFPKFTLKPVVKPPPGLVKNLPIYDGDECRSPIPELCTEEEKEKEKEKEKGDPKEPKKSKDGEKSEDGGEEGQYEGYYYDYDESCGVGLFKRNNVIILMVGSGGVLLLIGSRGTSGV